MECPSRQGAGVSTALESILVERRLLNLEWARANTGGLDPLPGWSYSRAGSEVFLTRARPPATCCCHHWRLTGTGNLSITSA